MIRVVSMWVLACASSALVLMAPVSRRSRCRFPRVPASDADVDSQTSTGVGKNAVTDSDAGADIEVDADAHTDLDAAAETEVDMANDADINIDNRR